MSVYLKEEEIMIEKIPMINLALFPFLTILLGIELGLTINLVLFSVYAVLLATTSASEGRQGKRGMKPDVKEIETAA